MIWETNLGNTNWGTKYFSDKTSGRRKYILLLSTTIVVFLTAIHQLYLINIQKWDTLTQAMAKDKCTDIGLLCIMWYGTTLYGSVTGWRSLQQQSTLKSICRQCQSWRTFDETREVGMINAESDVSQHQSAKQYHKLVTDWNKSELQTCTARTYNISYELRVSFGKHCTLQSHPWAYLYFNIYLSFNAAKMGVTKFCSFFIFVGTPKYPLLAGYHVHSGRVFLKSNVSVIKLIS